MIGGRLSHFEIVGALGSGGMGEVYRARDTKLGREVAIKVLPDEFARDEERLARFQREAKVLASLNHPNIASIYGLEQSKDTHYLVLELVEGETLAERIATGPIPREEALAIAVQIAEGLDEAHERGIVHRDLKPANVKLTPDDKIKVLDFGLAKAFAEESAEADSSMSPTITRDATRAGVILGTAAYMSPEQAKGKRVDKRADIFAFGAVLYEMLTGKKAFPGDDVSEVLAAVIKLDPDWKALPPELTPLLKRCLDKDPRRRWRDIGDVKLELESDEPMQAPAVVPPRRSWGVIAAGALLIAALAAALGWNLRPEPPRVVGRFAVNLPEDANFSFGGRRVVAVSPEGGRIAFVANFRMYLRSLDETESVLLEDTQGARTPVFSPDGEWIGFYADGAINKVSVHGGPRVRLCAAENPFGASWNDDDTILFGQGDRGIWRVSAQGGKPELVVEVGEGERAHGPDLIPGTRFILYSVVDGANWDEARIEVTSLDGGERTVLIRGGSDARYVPTGHIVYAVDDTLVAVPFDAGSLEVLGGPVPVIEDVARSQSSTATAHVSFSDNGSLAYVPREQIALRTLVWVDRDGRAGEPLVEAANYRTAVPSPDGNRLALVEGSSPPNVWILDVDRSTLTRLTTEGAEYPVWSPDGEWLVFGSSSELYRQRTDFSGNAERLLEGNDRIRPHAYSTDGQWLVYGLQENDLAESGWNLWALRLEGDGEPQPTAVSELSAPRATLSPDARYLAYESGEGNRRRSEIYVTPFPQSGQKWQISSGGGAQPLWSWDGRTIFYQEYGDTLSKIMSVRVETSAEFEWSSPELVMEWPTLDGPERHFAVSPDGERFVMLRDVNTGSGRIYFNVVLNWFDELERLVPRP